MRFDADEIDAIAAAIASRLGLVPGPAPPAADDVYVTRTAAARLGLERRALLRAERLGELAAFKPGKTVVYRRADVLALIERSRIGPEPANDAQPAGSDAFERAVANARGGR